MVINQVSRATLTACLVVIALFPSGFAQAAAIFSSSMDAKISIGDTSGLTQLLSFISDDGSSSATTAFVDPVGSPGSFADAQGSVDLSKTNDGQFLTGIRASGIALGVEPALPVNSFGAAQAGGGFTILNPTTSELSVTVTVDWTWLVSLINDRPVDLALALLSLTVFDDGVPLETLVNASFGTPPSADLSDTSSWSRTFSVAGGGERSFSILASTTGVAQSTGVVSEPNMLMTFIFAGILMLGWGRRRLKIRRW